MIEVHTAGGCSHSLSQIRSVMSSTTVAIHEGVKCDGCGESPLTGTRRRCLLCLDVDLCPTCCDDHEHDVFIVLPEPTNARWGEVLRLLTCFGALAGADEFNGRTGLRAPPPDELDTRLRAFLCAGAAAICPPGPALAPIPDPASFLESEAQLRQRGRLRRDAARRREREARDAKSKGFLDPRFFEKLAEVVADDVPRTNSPSRTQERQAFTAYLPRRAGGGMCLVSDIDGTPLVNAQIYAVSSKTEAKDLDEEVDGVVSTLVRLDGTATTDLNVPEPVAASKFHAIFGEDDVEVRILFTNISERAGPLRLRVRSCDASGNVSDSSPPIFDMVVAPLESVEMTADQTTGRALLLRAARHVVTASASTSGLPANVTLREELHKSLHQATGSYLLISVAPTGLIHFGGIESARYWDSLRWHSLDMFVAPRKIQTPSIYPNLPPNLPRGGGLFGTAPSGFPFESSSSVFGMATAPSPSVNTFGATPAATANPPSSERATPLGTLPSSVLPFDATGATVAQLSPGRLVDEEPSSRAPPFGPGAYTSAFHQERDVIVGLAVESTLRAAPWESDDDTLREANRLLAAAKESGLVSLYNESVRLTHTSGTCVICLEENPPADFILLPCKHQCMHGKCMSATMRRCPLCRARIEWTLGKGDDGRIMCKQISGDSLGMVDRTGMVDRGRRPAFDIGEWTPVNVDDVSPGDRLLLDLTMADASSAPPAVVNSIALGAGGPPLTVMRDRLTKIDPVREVRCVLDRVQCAALIARIEKKLGDEEHGATCDFKMDVTKKEACDLIGRDKVDELIIVGKEHLSCLKEIGGISTQRTLADARPQIKLRRRATVPGTERHVIPFHRDCSLVVVNVALNDDFIGANLVYIIPGRDECARLWTPHRAPGDVTVHDCTTVHGVSRLAAGVRYNMYIVFESSLTPAAA